MARVRARARTGARAKDIQILDMYIGSDIGRRYRMSDILVSFCLKRYPTQVD